MSEAVPTIKRRSKKFTKGASNNPRRDVTKERFGHLVGIRFSKVDESGATWWEFQCDCGLVVEKRLNGVIHGGVRSCGCARRRNMKNIGEGNSPDLTNKRFSSLVVVERAEGIFHKNGWPITQYLCRCDCGTETTVKAVSLRHGLTRSCGRCHPLASDFEHWMKSISATAVAIQEHAKLTRVQIIRLKAGIEDSSLSATSCRRLLDLGCPSHLLPLRKNNLEVVPCMRCGKRITSTIDEIVDRAVKGELTNCGCSLIPNEPVAISQKKSLWTGMSETLEKAREREAANGN